MACSKTSPPAPPRRLMLRGGARWVALAVLFAAASALVWSWTRPPDRFDLDGRAAAALARGRPRTALRDALAFLARRPADPAANLMAARCLVRLGRHAEAERHFTRAEPLSAADQHDRALGLVLLDRPLEAAALYTELIDTSPNDVLALKRLAAVRLGLAQAREVVPIAERLIQIPGAEVAGQTLLAYAFHQGKHFKQAAAAAQRVLELDPQLDAIPIPRALFYTHLALDLMAIGRDEPARRHLEHALVRDDDASLKELLGVVCQRLGQLEEAERNWREAVSQDPANADAWLDLGRLAMTRRDGREAVRCFERAAQLSSQAVEPLYNLSLAYRMLGDRAAAERARQRADANRQAAPPSQGGMGAPADTVQSATPQHQPQP